MEETKNIWNTKTSDLTVGEGVKLSLAVPIIMIGGVVAACAITAMSSKVVNKFRSVRKNNQDHKTEEKE